MKTIILTLTLALTTLASAASFDTAAFGTSLNGWGKDNTARYALGDGNYTTHMPAITTTHSGGMFLTTRVDLDAYGRDRSTCHISLTFSRSGALESAQIKGVIGNKSVDTGLVRRTEPTEDSTNADPTADLIAVLFSQFDSEVSKVRTEEEKDRSDFFSRLVSKRGRSGDLSAGLRHNLNLILAQVRN